MRLLPRPSWLLWILVLTLPTFVQAQQVLPDSILNAALVTPYKGQWRQLVKMSGQPDKEQVTFVEQAEVIHWGNKPVLRRIQRVELPNSMGMMVDTLFLDAETLVPLRKRFHHPQVSASFDYDWDNNTLTQSVPGQTEPTVIDLEGPAYDAFVLGLTLKALPLEEHYQVTFPAYLVSPANPSQNSKWWVTARVVGSKMFDPGDGNLVDTWVVETDWVGEDHTVSPGGGSGGTTYIIKETPEGAAHVANVVTENQPGVFTWIVMRDGL